MAEVHWLLLHPVCLPHKLQGATWSWMSCTSVHKPINPREMHLLLALISCRVWTSWRHKLVRHIKTWRGRVVKFRKAIKLTEKGQSSQFPQRQKTQAPPASGFLWSPSLSGSASFLTFDLAASLPLPHCSERSSRSLRGDPGSPVRSSRPGAGCSRLLHRWVSFGFICWRILSGLHVRTALNGGPQPEASGLVSDSIIPEHKGTQTQVVFENCPHWQSAAFSVWLPLDARRVGV